MGDEWRQWEDLPPEKEAELIEKLADLLVKNRIGLLGRVLLESGGTLTSLFAEFYMGIYGPYFDFLEVDEYVALLRRKENIPKLLARIEEKETKLNQ
jgi:delta 1-pyrroline-5-carboxylate dehydrogenase